MKVTENSWDQVIGFNSGNKCFRGSGFRGVELVAESEAHKGLFDRSFSEAKTVRFAREAFQARSDQNSGTGALKSFCQKELKVIQDRLSKIENKTNSLSSGDVKSLKKDLRAIEELESTLVHLNEEDSKTFSRDLLDMKVRSFRQMSGYSKARYESLQGKGFIKKRKRIIAADRWRSREKRLARLELTQLLQSDKPVTKELHDALGRHNPKDFNSKLKPGKWGGVLFAQGMDKLERYSEDIQCDEIMLGSELVDRFKNLKKNPENTEWSDQDDKKMAQVILYLDSNYFGENADVLGEKGLSEGKKGDRLASDVQLFSKKASLSCLAERYRRECPNKWAWRHSPRISERSSLDEEDLERGHEEIKNMIELSKLMNPQVDFSEGSPHPYLDLLISEDDINITIHELKDKIELNEKIKEALENPKEGQVSLLRLHFMLQYAQKMDAETIAKAYLNDLESTFVDLNSKYRNTTLSALETNLIGGWDYGVAHAIRNKILEESVDLEEVKKRVLRLTTVFGLPFRSNEPSITAQELYSILEKRTEKFTGENTEKHQEAFVEILQFWEKTEKWFWIPGGAASEYFTKTEKLIESLPEGKFKESANEIWKRVTKMKASADKVGEIRGNPFQGNFDVYIELDDRS